MAAKKESSKGNTENKTGDISFSGIFDDIHVTDDTPEVKLVNKGQYKDAFDLLEDAEACQLTPMLVGPPGTGKTLLARSYAASRSRQFEWLTLDESTKPVHLVGAFDPVATINKGFVKEAFLPGPLTRMMAYGGIFLANELNRATEFTQNSFLEPLEERSVMLPRLGRIRSKDDFFLICAANPGDMAGTHRISEALKDRIKVWINLTYPERSVEMEIIKANTPETKISKDYLELTHQLIVQTRKSREIERPASVRSAIAIAKLAGRKEASKDGLSSDAFAKIARQVLKGGIKVRPGINEDSIVQKIVSSVVRA